MRNTRPTRRKSKLWRGPARIAPHSRSALALDRPSRCDCRELACVDRVARERTSIPELQRGQNRKESGARRFSRSCIRWGDCRFAGGAAESVKAFFRRRRAFLLLQAVGFEGPEKTANE